MSEYKFTGLPLHYGADNLGLKYSIKELNKELQKKGRKQIKELQLYEENEEFEETNMLYKNSILKSCEDLAKEVDTIIAEGNIPVSIGGDHAMAIGSISGSAVHYENLGVLWVDSHGDFNTDETTISGRIHGMPLAAVQGIGHKDLVHLYEEKVKVKTENVVIFDVRSLDQEEARLIKEAGVKVYSHQKVMEMGFENAFLDAMKYIKEKTNQLHVSLDLDSMNPELMPGVSIPVKDGLTPNQVRKIVAYFIEGEGKKIMKSMDIVEYNPIFDKNRITRDFVIELLETMK